MPPKQSDQKSSIQNHSADAFEHAPFDPLEHGVMAGGTPFQPKQGGASCEFSSFRAKRAANCIQRAMKESFPFCAICLCLHRKSDMHAWRSKCGHQFCKQCSKGLRQQSTVVCPLCRKGPLPTQPRLDLRTATHEEVHQQFAELLREQEHVRSARRRQLQQHPVERRWERHANEPNYCQKLWTALHTCVPALLSPSNSSPY